jgi:dihydrofolate reductase
MKLIKAIAAMAENRVIGCGNRIPWHLPEDFKWFKRITTGHILVMGRKTFESIGKPLPHRDTIVLSRSSPSIPGVEVRSDWREIPRRDDPREIFICGGAQIYAQTLPFCSDLFLTHVKRRVEGDAFFPPYEDQFEWERDIMENADFKVVHYRRRSGYSKC